MSHINNKKIPKFDINLMVTLKATSFILLGVSNAVEIISQHYIPNYVSNFLPFYHFGAIQCYNSAKYKYFERISTTQIFYQFKTAFTTTSTTVSES